MWAKFDRSDGFIEIYAMQGHEKRENQREKRDGEHMNSHVAKTQKRTDERRSCTQLGRMTATFYSFTDRFRLKIIR